jgi:hypothetical protein
MTNPQTSLVVRAAGILRLSLTARPSPQPPGAESNGRVGVIAIGPWLYGPMAALFLSAQAAIDQAARDQLNRASRDSQSSDLLSPAAARSVTQGSR